MIYTMADIIDLSCSDDIRLDMLPEIVIVPTIDRYSSLLVLPSPEADSSFSTAIGI